VSDAPLRYLALGDSYTIGTGASNPERSWPAIIAGRLKTEVGRDVQLTNPAVSGYTTLDVIDKQLHLIKQVKPDFVTVLVGVNDLVTNRGADDYRSSLVRIYNEIGSLELHAGRAVAIAIPNWSVVPAALEYGEAPLIRATTNSFNGVARQEAEERGFTWVDITIVSTSGLGSKGWIASDNLHPGDSQYAAWADVIWAAVRDSWVRP
jgi:lysophospholipase L1-like esterase